MGRIRRQPYHATAGTYHDDAMLTLVRQGAGYYHKGGTAQRVGQGDLGLVLPSADPGVLVADQHQPYDHYYCRFAGREALRMARCFADRRKPRRFAAEKHWQQVSNLFALMVALQGDSPPAQSGFMTQAEAELARLLALLLAPPEVAGPKLTEAGLRRYLLDNLPRSFSLDDMVGHFGVSRSYLCRQAKRLLGAPLSRVCVQMRIELAVELLQADPPFTISDIANRVGYEDPLYFSRLFRRHMGASPSHFRDRKRAGRRVRAG